MPTRLKRHIFTYDVLVSGHNSYHSILYGHNDSGVSGCIGKVLFSCSNVSWAGWPTSKFLSSLLPSLRCGCPMSRDVRDMGSFHARTTKLYPFLPLQLQHTPIVHLHNSGFSESVGSKAAPPP